MADNTTLNAGTGGNTIATDDIGGVHYPRSKISLGADGTAVDAIPVANGMDTTATGVQAVGVVGQFDDTSTGTVTENQFAPVRISSRRALLVEGVASGTVIPVSDGGGALTVDGTVAVSGTVTVDGSGATQPVSHAALTELAAAIDTEMQVDVVGALPAGDNNIGNVDIASAIPAGTNNIGDVDILSVVPGVGATNLGKAEDAAHTTGDVGVMALGVRQSSQADFGADGDYVPFSVDDDGGLRVSIVAGAGSGGTAAADDADFTAGTTSGTPAMGVYESTPTSVTDGDLGTVGITTSRALKVAIVDDAGAELTIADVTALANANVLHVSLADGNGDDQVVIRAEDAGHTSGDFGIPALAVRRDTAAVGSGTDGDYSTLNVNASGRLYTSTTVDAALPAGTNNIGDVDVLSVVPGTGATALGKAEDAAHTTADTGVYALAVRDDAPAAHSGTDGDYESLHVNAEGGLWVSPTPSASGGLTTFRSIDLDESEEQVKATAGSLYGWFIANRATSPLYVKFYNDTAANVSVGTTTPQMTFPIPANSTNFVAANMASAHGIAFSTAITVAATTGVADNDTGAPGANECVVNLWYK